MTDIFDNSSTSINVIEGWTTGTAAVLGISDIVIVAIDRVNGSIISFFTTISRNMTNLSYFDLRLNM